MIVAVVIVPLLGAVLTPIVAGRSGRGAAPWAFGTMVLTSAIGIYLMVHVAQVGPFSAYLGGWEPPYGIELRFDEFSASISVICLLGALSILFSFRYAEKELPAERLRYYYTLLLLNLAGMIGFVVTGDLFNLFVFMEILSLSSYALVAVSGERIAEMAAFKYLIMGAVSSLLVLLGIGVLYALTGSLNMADISTRLTGAPEAPAMLAFAVIAVGFMVKAAIFPLHIWLPDAHAIAPSPVSAILSGLVVKTGLLGLIRLYQMYYGARVLDLSAFNLMLVWLGAISIVMGAFFAIFQEDIKMMLAYSTISNVVGRSMPLTTAAISIGAISIVGIPPTAGFLCKWYIALGAIEANQPFFGFALVFGALFIFVYYIRMVNAFYFQQPVHPEIMEVQEAPLSMLVPVLTLAALCLIMGILGRLPLSFIEPAVARLLGPMGG